MINEATIMKLIKMRLSVMAESYRQQLSDVSMHALSFDERLALLVLILNLPIDATGIL